MKSILYFNLFYFFPNFGCSKDFYTGAVVEYEPLNSEELPTPIEVMTYNADKYDEFISLASTREVDIIVFPEYGMTGAMLSNMEDGEIMVMGDVGMNYCNKNRITHNESNDQVILSIFSCSAKNHNMYVVINTREMVIGDEQD